MFVAEGPDEYRLIAQPDHANLSGQVTLHWGNDEFDPPEPHHSMVVAAEGHDHGWNTYDLEPHLKPDEQKPIGFLEVTSDEWTSFYGGGVEASADVDPYGGLMVSLHASGLRRQGYGVRPEMTDMHKDPGYADFVEVQEAFQTDLMEEMSQSEEYAEYATEEERAFLREIHETGEYSGRCRTWYNYHLLQVFDRLSIYYCNNYSLEETTIGPAPVTYDGEEVELTVTPVGDAEVTVDPYPFDASPLTFSTSGRRIPKTFESQGELTRLYYESERRPMELTVRE